MWQDDRALELTVAEIRSLRPHEGIDRVAVGCVGFRPGRLGHELLVLRRAPGLSFGGIEELPSGGVEPGETLAQAVVREMEEEIGVTGVQPGPMLFEFSYDSPKGHTIQFNFMFVLGDQRIALSPEHVSSRWLPVSRLAASDLTPAVQVGVRKSMARGLTQLRR